MLCATPDAVIQEPLDRMPPVLDGGAGEVLASDLHSDTVPNTVDCDIVL
jgi:hypothetical protein